MKFCCTLVALIFIAIGRLTIQLFWQKNNQIFLPKKNFRDFPQSSHFFVNKYSLKHTWVMNIMFLLALFRTRWPGQEHVWWFIIKGKSTRIALCISRILLRKTLFFLDFFRAYHRNRGWYIKVSGTKNLVTE